MNTDGPACGMRRNEATKYMAQVKVTHLSHKSSSYSHLSKERFATDPDRFTRFLKAFGDIYGSGAPDRSYEERIELIRKEMRDDVLKGHEDLMEGFEAFIEPGR
jgi:hypothetical protein